MGNLILLNRDQASRTNHLELVHTQMNFAPTPYHTAPCLSCLTSTILRPRRHEDTLLQRRILSQCDYVSEDQFFHANIEHSLSVGWIIQSSVHAEALFLLVSNISTSIACLHVGNVKQRENYYRCYR